MTEVVQADSFVVLKRIVKVDPRTRANVAVFFPVRVTLTDEDADAYIMFDAKQNINAAKQNYKKIKATCDLSIPVIRQITGGGSGLLKSGGGILTPSGVIVTGKPRMDA